MGKVVLLLLLSHLLAASISLQAGLFFAQQQQNAESTCKRRRKKRVRRRPKLVGIPTGMRAWLSGMVRVDRDSFTRALNLGTPLEPSANNNSKIVLWYPTETSLSTAAKVAMIWKERGKTEPYFSFPPVASLEQATPNCRRIHVAHLSTYKKGFRTQQTCVALVGSAWEDSIFKWVRLHPRVLRALRKAHPSGKFDQYTKDSPQPLPLFYANRYAYIGNLGDQLGLPPKPEFQDFFLQDELPNYLKMIPNVLEQLRPIASKVANNNNPRNVITVMVSNHGHAELLVNYVCAAKRAKMTTLNNILVFSTDAATHEWAQALGLHSFFHAQLFQSIPSGQSTSYGSPLYAKIMLSKVYCVHLINLLGYDILFQDTDIIPYNSHYLEWFLEQAKAQPQFDLFFQYDWNIRNSYAPWVANSGCYFVRHSPKTRYLFHDLLLRGDVILHGGSHQAVKHASMSQLSTVYGLRIKTFQQESELLPIGWHYHRDFPFMRKFIASKQKNKTMSLSFHMNWNSNKQDKRHFLEQMGDWHVQEVCLGEQSWSNISSSSKNAVQLCCAAQPLVKCHYNDKPSIIPCKASPTFQNLPGKKSFW